MEANIQPLKIHRAFSSEGFRSQIWKKAADSGCSIRAALRQARKRIKSELPNLMVLSIGKSKVLVRADILSMVRTTAMGISSISRATAGQLIVSKKIKVKINRTAFIKFFYGLSGAAAAGVSFAALSSPFSLVRLKMTCPKSCSRLGVDCV